MWRDQLIEMVQVPAGTLSWDSATITLSAFKMGKYEVTQEQYQAVMGTNPSYFNEGPTIIGYDDFSREPAEGEEQGKRPVEGVSWYEAVEFCNKLSELEGLTPFYNIDKINKDPNNKDEDGGKKWLVTTNETANGFRLPTEAQWEYACRAGTTTDWYFGSTESQLVNYTWYGTNSNYITHEVGKKLPNAFGLYDMHGNIFEWCWDWFGNYPTSNQTDYTGAASGRDRVVRGGSWFLSVEYSRSASRYGDLPSDGYSDIGFRVVRP